MTHIPEDDLVILASEPALIEPEIRREHQRHVLTCRCCRTRLKFFETFYDHLSEEGYKEPAALQELLLILDPLHSPR